MGIQPLAVDFLLTGGTIITMDAEQRILHNGVVVVKNGQIEWIGARDELGDRFDAAQTLDLSGKVLIPGLINAHGHWAMTLFRGLVDDRPLESWLQTIWKVEAAFVNAANVTVGSELAMVEMIRCGTTCAADMYWQYEETFESIRRAGFRLVNGPIFAEIPGFENRENVSYDSALELLDRYQNDPLIHLRIQAHSTYTTNLRILEDIARIAEDRHLGFITHASESKGELEIVKQKYGKSPIEVLDSVGLLGKDTLLAHCVHLSDREIERLASTGTSIVHCPSSNLKLSSGIARIADLLHAGVNVAIGTDGPASNNDLDLFHEAQLAALVQKGITGDPTVLPAEKVFAMLTIDGARAVGLADRIGSIEVGKLADLAVLDFDAVNLTPCYDLYSHLVYAASAADVCHVMVNGRLVMQNREMLTLDEERIKSQIRSVAQQIRLI